VKLQEKGVEMDPRQSMLLYPRPDNMYKKKGSLNFDLMRSKIYAQRKYNVMIPWLQICALLMIGMLIGLIASVMEYAVQFLISTKVGYTDQLIGGDKQNMASGWAFFMAYSVLFSSIGSILCVWWAPKSAGSGIPELIAYMNGIKTPGQFDLSTFFVKIIGCMSAQAAGLCLGQEGPLAHIGACAAMAVIYLPFPGFAPFHNDVYGRQFVAAGLAAGISCAFGAPIGGVLLAYELSVPNTFWKFEGLWKSFICCTTAVFMLAFMSDLY
jgi:chloride channel 7